MKLILSHPGIGELTVAVDERGLIVGRQGGSPDLEMNWDGRVSRRHARFWLADGAVWIQDLDSRNGTWLDTVRLDQPLRLDHGMRVAVGETWFWLAEESKLEPAPTASAPSEASPLPASTSTPPSAVTTTSTAQFDIVIEDALERTLEAYEPESDEVKNTSEMPAMRKPVVVATRALPVPQMASETEVTLRADREGLNAIWMDSLSKGALFVPTDRPPAGRTNIKVRLETLGGTLELHAEVVHVVDARGGAALGQSPGVGLHITDLTAENRAAIHRFVTGQVERLELPKSHVAPKKEKETTIDLELGRAREFISRVEANDLYAALGVSSIAPDGEIRKRIGELKTSFTAAQAHATPPQVTRLAGAVRLLERAAITLGDPIRRLEYDFRRGDVRAEERMLRAKDASGASLPQLREAWVRSFPGDVDAAAALAKKAATAKRSREILLAIETMRAAIRLDPFHEELRETLREWEKLLPPRKAT